MLQDQYQTPKREFSSNVRILRQQQKRRHRNVSKRSFNLKEGWYEISKGTLIMQFGVV